MILIRPEGPSDIAPIRDINEKAFGRPAEASLVDRLRDAGRLVLSLVAHDDGEVVGHIAFSTVTIEGSPSASPVMGLAPMAVRPDRQRQGIGSRLVMKGVHAARESGTGAVVVLGHPDYYPKFGFQPASRFGLRCAFAGTPDNAFMALELSTNALPRSGVVRFDPLFDDVA